MDKGGLREEPLAASKALVLLEASWTAERQGGWGGGQVPRLPCVALALLCGDSRALTSRAAGTPGETGCARPQGALI